MVTAFLPAVCLLNVCFVCLFFKLLDSFIHLKMLPVEGEFQTQLCESEHSHCSLNGLLWPLQRKDFDCCVIFTSCLHVADFPFEAELEMFDYVSIKHIHCPAINALIAGVAENLLGSFNNGVVFIREHSDVGLVPTLQSLHGAISSLSQLEHIEILGLWVSVWSFI